MVLQRNTFRNQNMSLKDKKGVNDLIHMSLKQIQMLATFYKYNLLLLYENNHYIYIYICSCHSANHKCMGQRHCSAGLARWAGCLVGWFDL